MHASPARTSPPALELPPPPPKFTVPLAIPLSPVAATPPGLPPAPPFAFA
jgi:hypothetical protein